MDTTESLSETLYNGIELPVQWPPNYGEPTGAPMPVPYLDNPSDVIPIDVGRQLFVDDFLIETRPCIGHFIPRGRTPATPSLTFRPIAAVSGTIRTKAFSRIGTISDATG